MNVTGPIRRIARMNPTGVAVIRADGSSVSYRALDRTIAVAAHGLAVVGIAAGQTAGLGITGPDEFPGLIVALALARIGVASADLALPAESMDVCIVETGGVAKPGVRCVPIEAIYGGVSADDTDTPDAVGGPGVFRIFASSGTTGTPHFSAISHDMMASRVADSWLAIGQLEPVQICAAGMGITWGCTRVLRTFWSGGTLVLTNPAEAVMTIKRHRVGALSIAPVSLRQVLATMPAGAARPPSLQLIEVSGSALPPQLGAAVRQRLCNTIFSHFGATEAGGIASGPVSAMSQIPGAVGYVHAGIQVQAVDSDDRPLPPGTDGILRMRGANVIGGYLGDPVASETVFRDGWFYCGDIGSVSADGLLTVSGRASDFINAGGIKLSPNIVEDVLLAVPPVTDAAAFGVPDRMGVVQIWAAIVAPRPVDASVLHGVCQQVLGQKAPAFIIQINQIPRNPNGKVQRDALIAFATERRP